MDYRSNTDLVLVDELQKQLDMHKIEINHLQARVRQQDQALHFYQLKYPGISPDSSMLAFQPQAPEFISPNPLLQTSIGYQHSMASNSSPSTSPGLPPSMTDSPDSLLKTLDSPATSGSQPATPPTEMHGLFTTTPNQCKKVDQTQHSAAMLWPGLQCRSTFPMGSVSTPHKYHPTTLLSTFLAIFNLTISSLQHMISNCLEQALMTYSQMFPTLSLSIPLPCSLPLLVQTFMRLASQTPPISSRTCTLLAQAHTLCATSPAPLLSLKNSLLSDELSIERTVGHRPLDESLREADVGWRRRSRTMGRSGDDGYWKTRWVDVGGGS